MNPGKPRWRTLLIGLALAAVTIVCYLPVLHNEFVTYDDYDYVVENVHVIRGLNRESVAWAFTHGYSGNWHPLTWMSHALDVSLFGLNPAGHHAVNLLFHTLNSVLLFLALQGLTRATWRSAFVAALFALHPAHVESVAWVAERKDVLSGFFFLLTLLAYTRYAHAKDAPNDAKDPKPTSQKPAVLHPLRWYGLALLLFACGLMSKPMLVTLPFVLLLLDFWPLNRFNRAIPLRLVTEKLPFFALAAISCVVTFQIQQRFGAVAALDAATPEFRFTNSVISYVRYLDMMFWPGNLAVFYPSPKGWPGWLVVGALLLLLALSYLAVKRKSYLLTGWFFFVGTLVPVIGIIQVGNQSMADRYTYLPFIGLFIAVTWWLADLAARWPVTRQVVAPAAVLVLTACGYLTSKQAAFWHDSRALYEHAIAATGDNTMAQNNLGVLLLKAGDYAAATPHIEEAVRLDPNYADALQNLGLCRQHQGQTGEAIQLYHRTLQLKPVPEAYLNLGELDIGQTNYADAAGEFEAALRIRPELVEAWYELGRTRAVMGQTDAAREAYLRTLQLRPGFELAHVGLGLTAYGEGKFDEAIAQFEAGAPAMTSNLNAQLAFAFALGAKGRFPEAQLHYAECCQLEPTNLVAREGLGLSFFYQGKLAEAVPPLEQVVASRPDPKAHYLLALALHGQGNLDAALPHYREAVRLDPNNPDYLNDLAWNLATAAKPEVRDGKEAVRLAETACKLSDGKQARYFGSLDAAYAEVGRFEEAIATATKTQELAVAAGQKEIAQAAAERLALYRQNQPYHQPQ